MGSSKVAAFLLLSFAFLHHLHCRKAKDFAKDLEKSFLYLTIIQGYWLKELIEFIPICFLPIPRTVGFLGFFSYWLRLQAQIRLACSVNTPSTVVVDSVVMRTAFPTVEVVSASKMQPCLVVCLDLFNSLKAERIHFVHLS